MRFTGKNTGGCTSKRCEAYDLVVTATLINAGEKTVMKDLTGVCGAYH